MGTNTHSYDIHQASLTPHSVQPISRGKVNPIEFNLAEHTDPPNNRANLWEEFRYKADDFREWLATRCCACLSSIPSFALVIITAVLIMLLIATIPLAFALTYMNPQPSTAEDSLRDNGTDFPYTVDRIHSAWPNESEMIEYKDWDDLTTVRSTSLLPKNISVCSIYGFACTGKPNIVIPKNRRCDGYADCEDGSDELDCHECQTTLSCPSTDGKHSHRKLCLVGAHLCDKQKYCPNGEDETIYCQSECKEGQFKCQGEDICIPEEAVCDGEPQCPFGDDEKNCKDECKNGAKKCGKDTCLPKRQLCDGFVDCPDSSDEKDCDCSSCSGRNSALCNGVDKLCISKEKVCDGHDDCPGAEDEHGCHGVCPMPVSKSEEIDEEKNIEEEGGMPKDATVRCADGKLYYWEEACNGLKADCQHSCAKCNPAMAFQCHSDVTQQMKNLSIIGLDKTIDGDNSTSESATNLSIHQIFKECIHRTLVCDGKRDCADGSDEANCACGGPKTLECKQHFPSEASMVVRSCYLESQKCDGFSDCIGGEDERDCDTCNNGAFLCQSEGRCIPTSARCDGTVDCLDQSDEQNCTCEECSRQPEQMYMCLGSNRCFPLRSVCKPYTICPNATKLDQLFCAVRGLEYF